MMLKPIVTIVALAAATVASPLFADDNCSMQVQPSAITVGSENDPAQLTFHTDVTYSSVDTQSLILILSLDNDNETEDETAAIEILSTFADSRGELVVRADWLVDEAIDKLKAGTTVEFELSGMAAGEPLECSDDVRLIIVSKVK